jgi:hypothetical protein
MHPKSTELLTASRGSAPAGRLRFRQGVRDLAVRTASLGEDLLLGHFLGPRPVLRVDGGDVTVSPVSLWQRLTTGDFDRTRLALVLSRDLPWAVEIGGGAAEIDADLRELTLRSLTIGGGVHGLVLALPRPVGRVPVRIGGGASRVFVLRPHGAEARVRIGGGAARLTIDRFEAGAIGGSTEIETPGFAGAEDAYEIEIGGGAADVTFREGTPRPAEAGPYRTSAPAPRFETRAVA